MTALQRVLTNPGPLLLDFDGPMCSIFSGYPAPTIAAELRDLAVSLGAELPGDERDPLEVLRSTTKYQRPDLTQAVEDALRVAERRAAESAEPTPGAEAVISAARSVGRPVGIASNNSEPAVRAYLSLHGLADDVAVVVGRAPYEPARMKPHPYSILAAAKGFGTPPGECVYLGDSLTDIEGAHAAGMPVIAYANKPGKAERFAAAGADVVVATMAEVAAALRLPD